MSYNNIFHCNDLSPTLSDCMESTLTSAIKATHSNKELRSVCVWSCMLSARDLLSFILKRCSYCLRRAGGRARSALAAARLACTSNVQPAAAEGEGQTSSDEEARGFNHCIASRTDHHTSLTKTLWNLWKKIKIKIKAKGKLKKHSVRNVFSLRWYTGMVAVPCTLTNVWKTKSSYVKPSAHA